MRVCVCVCVCVFVTVCLKARLLITTGEMHPYLQAEHVNKQLLRSDSLVQVVIEYVTQNELPTYINQHFHARYLTLDHNSLF